MAGNDLNENINDTNAVDNLLPHWNKTKADVWEFFGFESDGKGGYKDKNKVTCRKCKVKMNYTTCTTNMRSHINRFHYEEKHGKPNRTTGGPGAQLTIFDAMTRKSSFSLTSSRGKDISRSIVR